MRVAGPQCSANLYNHPSGSPVELSTPTSASMFFHLPFCVSQEKGEMVETAKSVLGLEETARQLLFLHSSKSSLESNLPVCYCIQTTPQLQRHPSPRPRLFYGRCRPIYPLSPHTHTHTYTHTHTHAYVYVRIRWEIHEAVRREPSLLVSSLCLAPERTNFACTRVALLFGNLTYVCLLARL